MQKSFIVEGVEANLDKITCLTDEIKEGINFRCLNAIGIWYADSDDADADLWDKVEAYIGVPLASLQYCKNQPHKLTSFM
tara:strand:+ start:101 stop:340 length:240 start_codon:yes stop_codon:yes gene_type:complete